MLTVFSLKETTKDKETTGFVTHILLWQSAVAFSFACKCINGFLTQLELREEKTKWKSEWS